jgi:hypothetical protein
MKTKNIINAGSLTWMLVLSLILVACAPAAGEVPLTGKDASAAQESMAMSDSSTEVISSAGESSAMAEELMKPAEPGEAEQVLEDADASIRAYEKRVLSGENFTTNLFERPFTSGEMLYLPDLNILTASIASDEVFLYFTLQLDGLNASSQLSGTYSVEFDRDQDGRGDLLVSASSPRGEWSMQDVSILKDMDLDVGGEKPMLAEVFKSGNGYEGAVENKGLAYARLTPGEEASLQLAVSRSLVEVQEFLWGAWADAGLRQPAQFDYHDAFTKMEAGMAIRDDEDYPLKAVAELDNTCRRAYNFSALAGIPGLCISLPEEKEPEREPQTPNRPPGTAPG